MKPFIDPKRLRRFEAKYIPEPNSGCWLWLAGVTAGYGYFWNGEKHEYAHRFSYRAYVGEFDLPQINHRCKNRLCVNPDHLEPCTCKYNLEYSNVWDYPRISFNALKPVCPRGHPYAGDNLYVRPNGDRECRECTRDYQRWLRQKRGGTGMRPVYKWGQT